MSTTLNHVSLLFQIVSGKNSATYAKIWFQSINGPTAATEENAKSCALTVNFWQSCQLHTLQFVAQIAQR